MRAVIQRVKQARVEVEGEVVGRIGEGMLILLGAGKDDTEEDARYLAEKIIALRIFEDSEGKMNLSVTDDGRRSPRRLPVHALRRLPERQASVVRQSRSSRSSPRNYTSSS